MNRAERRRLEKEKIKGESVPSLRLVDYMHIYSLSVILAMDSFELDKDLVRQIMAKVEENADCMLHKYISIADVEKMCIESYGINFVKELKRSNIFVNPDGTLMKG